MPIYEFECGSCGHRFEELSGVGAETAACPECAAKGAERRLSSFGVGTRQLTPGQQRRLEDKRGTNRDGARKRFGDSLAKARASDPAKRKPKA